MRSHHSNSKNIQVKVKNEKSKSWAHRHAKLNGTMVTSQLNLLVRFIFSSAKGDLHLNTSRSRQPLSMKHTSISRCKWKTLQILHSLCAPIGDWNVEKMQSKWANHTVFETISLWECDKTISRNRKRFRIDGHKWCLCGCSAAFSSDDVACVRAHAEKSTIQLNDSVRSRQHSQMYSWIIYTPLKWYL